MALASASRSTATPSPAGTATSSSTAPSTTSATRGRPDGSVACRSTDRTGDPMGTPLRVWVLCLYLMGLNLSNRQIAQELDLGVSDVQAMTKALRHGLTRQ